MTAPQAPIPCLEQLGVRGQAREISRRQRLGCSPWLRATRCPCGAVGDWGLGCVAHRCAGVDGGAQRVPTRRCPRSALARHASGSKPVVFEVEAAADVHRGCESRTDEGHRHWCILYWLLHSPGCHARAGPAVLVAPIDATVVPAAAAHGGIITLNLGYCGARVFPAWYGRGPSHWPPLVPATYPRTAVRAARGRGCRTAMRMRPRRPARGAYIGYSHVSG